MSTSFKRLTLGTHHRDRPASDPAKMGRQCSFKSLLSFNMLMVDSNKHKKDPRKVPYASGSRLNTRSFSPWKNWALFFMLNLKRKGNTRKVSRTPTPIMRPFENLRRALFSR